MNIQQYEVIFGFIPKVMSALCIVYILFLIMTPGAPKKLHKIYGIQILLCILYLTGSIYKKERSIFFSFFETLYFCSIVIINSEFYRYIFFDIKTKTREFTTFLKYMALPSDEKEKIQKKYFEKYPKFEMMQTRQKRLIYICEWVSLCVAAGSTILFLLLKS